MTISPITQQRGWSQLFEVRLRMDNPAQRLTPVLLPIDVTCGTAQVAVPARFAHGQRDRSATPPCVVCFAGLSRGVSCRDLLTKKRAPAGADGCRGSRTAVDAGQSRDSPTSPTGAMGRSCVPQAQRLTPLAGSPYLDPVAFFGNGSLTAAPPRCLLQVTQRDAPPCPIPLQQPQQPPG